MEMDGRNGRLAGRKSPLPFSREKPWEKGKKPYRSNPNVAQLYLPFM